LALEIIDRIGPLAATSANRSSEATPADLADIRSMFGSAVDVYVEGGSIGSRASTVVDVTQTQPVIVREGAITADEITHTLGFRFETG
jgi:tRNA A37 threonylcarbamoyladenosine synthetase subunit TsaC/SUA5/YrdC